MKKLLIFLSLMFFATQAFATLTTDNIKYGSSNSVTITLNSLANSATVGRCATAVDNTTTLADDYLVTTTIITGSGAPANDKAVYVYMSGSEDGTNYEQEHSTSPATDASYTINSPTIFRGPVVIPILTASDQFTKVFSVANMFGGVVPRKFSFIVINFTGQTLNATGNVITLTPITYTNQ